MQFAARIWHLGHTDNFAEGARLWIDINHTHRISLTI
jgi:hypothetical protein